MAKVATGIPGFDALPALGMVQTEHVCDGCGYILRGLAVRRDEATGLLLVRCAECGRWHAAADLPTPWRRWLDRQSMGFTRLAGLPMVCVLFGAIGPEMGLYDERFTFIWGLATSMALASLLGLLTMVLVAGVSSTTRWPLLVLAILAKSLMLLACLFLHMTVEYQSWAVWVMSLWTPALAITAADLAGALAGLALGRKVRRGLTRLLIPPGPRSALDSLWPEDSRQGAGGVTPLDARAGQGVEP